jgi:asparagine synthase (glutamine-hydrolysing)
MCGIAGIVSTNAQRFENEVQRMVTALHHRGPDQRGIHQFENCLLGHARLKIVDLFTGEQPMLSSDKQVAITFNGEIYGYKELKKTIKDYAFATTSDTEVILAIYQQQGTDMLKNLPGAFAFGIWDNQKQQLFCARDRFGEKPIYYALGKGGEFIFASEIKAILSAGLIDPILSTDAVAHYLKKLHVQPNETIYKNIYTLPPAHFLIYKNGKVDLKRYWSLPKVNTRLSLSDAIPEFRRLFQQAVNKQLVADVPVSVFLSGGLDSSSLVAVASEAVPGINTFSFGFGEAINELPYAELTAKKFNTKHQVLQSRDYDLTSLVFEMAKIYDEPFADSSNIPTYLISKEASKFSKVVLTGDGGDELLGGYDWYRTLFNQFDCGSNKSYTEFMFYRMLRKIYSLSKNNVKENTCKEKISTFEKIKQQNSILNQHRFNTTFFNENMLAGLLNKLEKARTVHYEFEITNTLNDAMNCDLTDYMPGDILVKTDRASLANSLELRAPFLDIDFASFCVSLPVNLKIDKSESKILLRRSKDSVLQLGNGLKKINLSP